MLTPVCDESKDCVRIYVGLHAIRFTLDAMVVAAGTVTPWGKTQE